MEFNEETMAQIVHIQLNRILSYCGKILEDGYVLSKDVNKIQKIFDIINDKEKKEEKLTEIKDIIL
jgi:hypothetical protein